MASDDKPDKKRLIAVARNERGEIIGVKNVALSPPPGTITPPSLPPSTPRPEIRLSDPPRETSVPPQDATRVDEAAIVLDDSTGDTNPEMKIVTSVGMLDSLAPGSRHGRRYIHVEAKLTLASGKVIRGTTRKVSSRGCFVEPRSMFFHLEGSSVVEVELSNGKRSACFEAEVVQVSSLGAGLSIRKITNDQRKRLERLLTETPEVERERRDSVTRGLQRVEAAKRAGGALPQLDAREDDEADTLFATSSRVLPRKRLTYAARALAVLGPFLVAAIAIVALRSGHSGGEPQLLEAGDPRLGHPIQVELRAEPPSTTFQIDDGPILPNPYVGPFPRDTRAHVIRAFAPDHVEQLRRVSFGADVSLGVTLERARIHPGDTPTPTPEGPSTH